MKRRRGRRGFWWWSWVLLLATIGATVGGYYYGEKRWEEAPKEYPAMAVLAFNVRDPFVPKGTKKDESTIADTNEAEALREIKSPKNMAQVIKDLDLTGRWSMGQDEAVAELLTSMDLEVLTEEGNLQVVIERHDPDEAAEIANKLARTIPSITDRLNKRNYGAGMEMMEAELEPHIAREKETREKLTQILKDNDIPIEPKPGMDMTAYKEIGPVSAANMEWQNALNLLSDLQRDQLDLRSYWNKTVPPSYVREKALPAASFSGPPLQPFQMEWGLYGLVGGMVLGLLLMAICWKLFP